MRAGRHLEGPDEVLAVDLAAAQARTSSPLQLVILALFAVHTVFRVLDRHEPLDVALLVLVAGAWPWLVLRGRAARRYLDASPVDPPSLPPPAPPPWPWLPASPKPASPPQPAPPATPSGWTPPL